jgi:hypothetical protein
MAAQKVAAVATPYIWIGKYRLNMLQVVLIMDATYASPRLTPRGESKEVDVPCVLLYHSAPPASGLANPARAEGGRRRPGPGGRWPTWPA